MAPPTAPRAIFFDFGGTLAVSLADLRPIFQDAARRTGVRVSWGLVRREEDRAWRELWPQAPSFLGRRPSFADTVHARALRRAGAQGPIPAMVERIREASLAPQWHPPFPETEAVLQALRARGYALHVLSNHTDYLPVIVRNLGWSGLFTSVTFSQEIGAEKPDPRLFELGLRRAGCAPAEAIHVGDLWDADYRGARAAGLVAIWLNRAGSVAPEPCAEVRNLREILDRMPGPHDSGQLRSGRAGAGARPRPRRSA